jgi:curved DNA-binding protein
MDFKDYYATLGVDKHATDKEIKQAYRRLARKYHPDVNPGDKAAEARFKEINEAYEVLSDPEKRKRYDELGANWRLYEQAQQSGQGFGAGWPFGTAWTVDFGDAGGGFRTATADHLRDLFGDEDPFSEFFHTFFGGRSGASRRGPAPSRGRDLEHDIELSLEDAFHGVAKRLTVRAGGAARSVEVRIPAGVQDGSRVRVAGEGEPGRGGAAAGDLYLRVHIRPHPIFERKGDDLHVKVPVPVTTAVLGGEVEVPTLTGPVRMKVPPVTQNGQVLRLRGHGMPVVGRAGARGDLYAVVDIQMPTRLTPEEREHYEALARLAAARRGEPVAGRR